MAADVSKQFRLMFRSVVTWIEVDISLDRCDSHGVGQVANGDLRLGPFAVKFSTANAVEHALTWRDRLPGRLDCM